MPITANLSDTTAQTLLSIHFKTKTLQALAMKAVAEIYGEDGFYSYPEMSRDVFFVSTINCSGLADAAVTYSEVIRAFPQAYGEPLLVDDAIMGVEEG